VVEGKPGGQRYRRRGGGALGSRRLRSSSSTRSLAITPFVQRGLPYDAARDFAAVIGLVTAASLVVIRSIPRCTISN
jgi:hypothetical protein